MADGLDVSPFDQDGDGQLSTGEIRDAFSSIDKDRDGVLTEDELRTGLKASDEQVQAILDTADKDGDGALDLKEFTHVMSLFNSPDSSLVNIMEDLALSRKMAERSNQARVEQIAGIRRKLEQERFEYRRELNEMRKAAQDKVYADVEGLRDKLYDFKSNQDTDASQMDDKIRIFREEFEKVKASITHVKERWDVVAHRAANRVPASQAIEALLRRS